MFKLKTDSNELKEALNIVDSSNYQYVVTDDLNMFEKDKINIFTDINLADETNDMLDTLAEGEKLYLIVNDVVGQKRVLVNQIQYIESIGDDIFVQMTEARFSVRMRLYQIEEVVMKKDFIRINRSQIVNIRKIDYIQPAVNSKISLVMKNGDKIFVKRTYLKKFKTALAL